MIDPKQLRQLVINVLTEESLGGAAAVELVLGTIAVESAGGRYIRQVRGPAVGISQVEPATFEWLKRHYFTRHPIVQTIEAQDLRWNLKAAIIFCRLRYRIVPRPLPNAHDIHGLAVYWKRSYNTAAGAGTVEHFLRSYSKYVKGLTA